MNSLTSLIVDSASARMRHVMDPVERAVRDLRLHARGKARIGSQRRLNGRHFFPHRRRAGGGRVQIIEDHIKHTLARPLERGLDLLGEDALNGQIFGVIEVRRLGVLEGAVAKRELRAAHVEVLVKRRQSHPVHLPCSPKEYTDGNRSCTPENCLGSMKAPAHIYER